MSAVKTEKNSEDLSVKYASLTSDVISETLLVRDTTLLGQYSCSDHPVSQSCVLRQSGAIGASVDDFQLFYCSFSVMRNFCDTLLRVG